VNILISFCNTIETPGFPNLGIIDLDSKDFSVVKLPPAISQTGITGLAKSAQFVFVGLQHLEGETKGYESPAALLIFDSMTFQLLATHPLKLVRDIHSFCWVEESSTLLIVSSGTDEVISLELHGTALVAEKVFWRPEPKDPREDVRHLNSIYRYLGDYYVSGFGKRELEGEWSSARNGFIINMTTGKQVMNAMYHPHSIDVISGQMMICESRTQKLRKVGSEDAATLPGYTRGLCHWDNKIFVGTSRSRKKSKSTGKIVDPVLQESRCAITRLSPEFNVEYTWDLDPYGIEIYELMIVEDVSQWPLMIPENYHRKFLQSWSYRETETWHTIRQMVPADSTLILVDDGLLQSGHQAYEYQCLPFLERNGLAWGPPASADHAINELIRMRDEGAQFIAFTWPSFWWFDHYKEFDDFLREKFKTVARTNNVVILQLTDSGETS
jgi:hypothetical protein